MGSVAISSARVWFAGFEAEEEVRAVERLTGMRRVTFATVRGKLRGG